MHPHIVVCDSPSGAGLCVHPLPPSQSGSGRSFKNHSSLIVVPKHLLIMPSVAAQSTEAAAAVVEAWREESGSVAGAINGIVRRKMEEIILNTDTI